MLYDFVIDADDAPGWFREQVAMDAAKLVLPSNNGSENGVDPWAINIRNEVLRSSEAYFTTTLICELCPYRQEYKITWPVTKKGTHNPPAKPIEELQSLVVQQGWRLGESIEFQSEGLMCPDCWAREIAFRAAMAAAIRKKQGEE